MLFWRLFCVLICSSFTRRPLYQATRQVAPIDQDVHPTDGRIKVSAKLESRYPRSHPTLYHATLPCSAVTIGDDAFVARFFQAIR